MIQLKDTLLLLARQQVDFVIIGGIAATLHGSVHQTFDLDVCYSRDLSNLDRLVAALSPHHPTLRGAPPNLPFIWDSATLRNGLNFTLHTALGDLDLFGEVAGIGDFSAVKAKSKTLELFGHRFSVLTLSGLIVAKRAAGRAQDLRIIPELEALLEATEGGASEG